MKGQLNFSDKSLIRCFIVGTLFLLCSTYSFGQVELFSLNNESKIIATKNQGNTIGLNLERKVYNDIISKEHQHLQLKIPFIRNSINLTLEKFQPFNNDLQVISKNSIGAKKLDITPTLLS